MKKMLIAIDGSECALKAVDYVGTQFSGVNDLQITLLHVLQYPPAPLWDDGHILTNEEREIRKRAVEKWLSNQQQKFEQIFREAAESLMAKGINPGQIETKSVSDSSDVAESILEVARDGGYQTLVMGRCGLTMSKRFLMGSVTTKVVNHGTGMAVCIVE